MELSPQKIVDQQVSVETKTPDATHSTEQSIENQTQQRLKAESEPTEVTFSQEALSQIKAWGSLKYNVGTDKEPKLVTFNPSKIEQARIAVLDRDGDKQISVEELSLNGDKIATKKEFEFLLNQGIETFQRSPETTLHVKPVPLPVKFGGPAMAEFNNPESNTKFGLQGRVNIPLKGGKANAFVYGNKGPNKAKLRENDATHSLVVRNPSQTQPMLLKVNGSFINKLDDEDKNKYVSISSFISGQALMKSPTGDVRRSDHELTRRMLDDDHQLKNQYVLIPSGGALELRSFSPSRDTDFRAFYKIEALADYPSDYTGVRNGLPVVPESVQMESLFLPASQRNSKEERPVLHSLSETQSKELDALINEHGYVEDISDDGIRHELKGSIDFQNPTQVIRAMEKDLWPQLLKIKPTANFTQEEIDGLKTRFQSLLKGVNEENPLAPLSDKILNRMNDWNAELKMNIQVLEGQGDKIIKKALWKSVIPLGRVVGVKEYSEAIAELPTVVLNGSRVEANYSLLMNPFNRAGTDAEPDIIPMISNSPNSVPPKNELGENQGTTLVPPDKSYGQYGVKYDISLTVKNELETDQPFDIRFGTTDEQGHTDWRNLFDSFDAYLKPDQARFTGAIKITIDGKEHRINLAQGKVQAPESLIKALKLSKGEHQIKIEMYVPTNNTGPHILQLLSQP
ncbi:hypothetical protein COW64_21635 [bacterium (Candidatus Blackallbacteria) CG18_big_fil_WC_8_21_14_2_50_49_26]|nr:MAG: hypothetical protein COW64_21635 [bacterium (Candidatus Blackallbacteria) CG18_big_fil_WC_8_21_14_2_50_49_26]